MDARPLFQNQFSQFSVTEQCWCSKSRLQSTIMFIIDLPTYFPIWPINHLVQKMSENSGKIAAAYWSFPKEEAVIGTYLVMSAQQAKTQI